MEIAYLVKKNLKEIPVDNLFNIIIQLLEIDFLKDNEQEFIQELFFEVIEARMIDEVHFSLFLKIFNQSCSKLSFVK